MDTFVTIEELSKQFSVSPSTIRAWIRQGMIPRDTYLKIGTTYRFNAAKIIAHFTQTSDEETPAPETAPAPTEMTPPTQLELDFGNPDEDL